MTDPEEKDALVKEVRLRRERRQRWLREGNTSVARRLAQIGVLGWIIVVPMLIGVFVGRWLDRTFNSGLFWTADARAGARMLVRLEMDEKRMRILSLDSLPAWAMFFGLAAHLAARIVLGVLYFHSLWWNACRFTAGGRLTTTIALMIGRFAILGGLLTLASLEGAPPLLAMALGVHIARSAAIHRVREAAQ
jgi:ATP synthase protein I